MRSNRPCKGLIGVIATVAILSSSAGVISAEAKESSAPNAAVAGTQTAATSTTIQSADTGESRTVGRFAGQAREVGLSRVQVESLQSRVDTYLHQLGGTQVSVNKIRVDESTEIVLALPGEKYARDITAQSGSTVKGRCAYPWFCAFFGPDYTGDSVSRYTCGILHIPWYTDGSWINNQYAGTMAEFKSTDGVTRWRSPAPDNDDFADWRWVGSVKNC